MAVIKLTVWDGGEHPILGKLLQLKLGDDLLLYRYRYPETEWPEHDTIAWPLKTKEERKRLRITLWDLIETGQLPSSTKAVLLPDGSEFQLDCEEDA